MSCTESECVILLTQIERPLLYQQTPTEGMLYGSKLPGIGNEESRYFYWSRLTSDNTASYSTRSVCNTLTLNALQPQGTALVKATEASSDVLPWLHGYETFEYASTTRWIGNRQTSTENDPERSILAR